MVGKFRIPSLFVVLLAASAFAGKPAQAGGWEKVYKVQVEYWFFDTDYYYWGDYYETTDEGAANFVYAILANAKQNGILNSAAPNVYWRYFAVDVRLVVSYRPAYKISPSQSFAQPSAMISRAQ